MPKNWCLWTVVLEKTPKSPLDSKEIKPVNLKGNQPWIFIGRTDAEAENSNTLATWCEELTPWKSLWCWKRLRAEGEEGITGWDGWMASPCSGHELGHTLGNGEGQGSLACYSPWGHKESDTTGWLNNNNWPQWSEGKLVWLVIPKLLLFLEQIGEVEK